MLRNLLKTYVKLNEASIYPILLQKRQAGHSKWANIRHVKGQKDKERSLLFTKLGRQMRIAAQDGGSADPNKNLKLEQVIEQAKRFNMPAATIQSILKSTQADKSKSRSYVFEIKGPGSSMILCEVFTDNLHHLKQSLSSILKKHSSRFSDGGGKHLFEQKGVIDTDLPKVEGKNSDEILELATEHAIESGAEDVRFSEDDNCLQFVCSETTFHNVQRKLHELNYNITSANVDYVPLKVQPLSDADLEICSSLYEKLENLSEIVKLYDNIA